MDASANKIALYEKQASGSTTVSNQFIDWFMTDANEVQIKVYLYLLRCAAGGMQISVASIADRFNYPERDILRALSYWDKQGLLTLDLDISHQVKAICLNEIKNDAASFPDYAQEAGTADHSECTRREEMAVPNGSDSRQSDMDESPAANGQAETGEASKENKAGLAHPFYSQEQLSEFQNREDVKGLVFMTEKYLGRTLTHSDVTSILFMFDSLHFKVELIEYLIEYCVNGGHRSMRYIESTAIAWKEKGISDVKEAKAETTAFNKDYFAILRAYGISGRNPVQTEIDYIKKWTDQYGFDLELILEAVSRTMSNTAKPSFRYTESILKSWYDRKVKHISDLGKLDSEHSRQKKPGNTASSNSKSDKFCNFQERNYDFDALEKKFAKN
ncbi:MAG: DnaD domain protein [Lachnospiraceae bacterium]|nr:DnaD domain protein [Lachnospiraceae bacterium]